MILAVEAGMFKEESCRDSCDIAKEGPSLDILNEQMGTGCRSVRELSMVFAISQTLASNLDLTNIVRPVLSRLRDMMGLERGTIAILNRDTRDFLISEAIGIPRGVSSQAYLELIENPLKRSVEKQEPVVIANLLGWGIENGFEEKRLRELGLIAEVGFICIPLVFDNESIGTLSIERRRDATVGWEADLRILGILASIIAQAAKTRQDAAEQMQSLRDENERLQLEVAHNFRSNNMIGNSPEMRIVYYHIEQVAGSVTSVLIRGESGTGKELVAKALHEKSDRNGKAFVKFNCGALPDSIIESELFGHEKGAFTGALAMRKGRFETADGGTIFLDEIGDVSQTTQVKLLRVLQEGEFERVGSQTTRKINVRVIAATSRNLEKMIEEGRFREDLYYRLNVFPIYVPPLRERKCDVLLLADYFIEKYTKRERTNPMRISSAAIDMLVSYHWPGNVRELENCIERAVVLGKGQSIKAHHLPPTLQKKSAIESKSMPTLDDAIMALEREMIIDTLKETNSNMAEASRRLGLTERKMGLRVKKYGIDLERYRK